MVIIGRLVIRNNKFKITKSTILFIKRNNLLSTLNKRSKMFVLSELFLCVHVIVRCLLCGIPDNQFCFIFRINTR